MRHRHSTRYGCKALVYTTGIGANIEGGFKIVRLRMAIYYGRRLMKPAAPDDYR